MVGLPYLSQFMFEHLKRVAGDNTQRTVSLLLQLVAHKYF
jgi:hypothetical protein